MQKIHDKKLRVIYNSNESYEKPLESNVKANTLS